MTQFDAATAVTPTADPRLWHADISPVMSIGGRTNGGYLLALASSAAVRKVESDGGAHLQPVAVSGAFTTSAPAGPTDVEVDVLRAGRGSSVVRVATSVGGEHSLEALVTCGSLPPAGSVPVYAGVPAPAMPAPEACVVLTPAGPGFHVALFTELEERADPATLGWTRGAPSGLAELRAWVSFVDGRPWDPVALVLAADCTPPATFDLGFSGWVPTMQMTVFVRAVPAPGPVLVRQVARVVSVGRGSGGRSATVDETCDVWDSTGTLVATGHQLAGLRLPG